MTEPFDFARAHTAHEDASRDQESAETTIGEKSRAYAQAEEAYRKALALEMWRLRRDEQVAWSSLADLARGEEEVARLKRDRDEAEGALSISNHAAYRRGADRRDTERFIAWSQARDLAEFHGRGARERGDEPVFGARGTT